MTKVKDVKTLEEALKELDKIKNRRSSWKRLADEGYGLKFKLFGIPLLVSLDP